MAGELNWSIPTGAEDLFRQTEKRLGWEERRPRIRKASDIMGPALGPTALQLDDLNGDVAAFNGMYLVMPGAIGSPDPTKWWAGQTIADRETGGTQSLSTFLPSDFPHVQMRRGFAISADGFVRQFSDWAEGTGGSGDEGDVYLELNVGDQGIANNSWLRLGFGSSATGDYWSYTSGTQSARYFEALQPSVSTFNFSMLWSGSSTGIRQCRVNWNGVDQPEYLSFVPGHAAGFSEVLTFTRRFAVGDRITLMVRQTSGGTLNVPEAMANVVRISG